MSNLFQLSQPVQPIQFIIIDGQTTKKLNLEMVNFDYFLIAISAIISFLILFGQAIEAHNLAISQIGENNNQAVILAKIIWWIICA